MTQVLHGVMSETTSIQHTGTYHLFETPKGAAHPRDVEHEGTFTATLPSTTMADAPVAFLLHDSSNYNGSLEAIEIRTWGGNLWLAKTSMRDDSPVRFGSDAFPASARLDRIDTRGCPTPADVQARVDEAAGVEDFLIIDGQVWERTGEPRFVVMDYLPGSRECPVL